MNTEPATEGTKSHKEIVTRTLQYYLEDMHPTKKHILWFPWIFMFKGMWEQMSHLRSKGLTEEEGLGSCFC